MEYGEEVKYDGKTYVAEKGSCMGCAFEETSCDKLPKCWGSANEGRSIHFIEKKTEQYGTVRAALPAHYERPIRVNPAMTAPYGAARATDPATSQAAAKTVKPLSLQQAILVCLYGAADMALQRRESFDGLTGKEIAEYTQRPLNSITPRFAQLRKAGKIEAAGMRRDKQIVWRLV